MIIKEILTPDFVISWLPWAVQYFFMIGIAYGAVWIATSSIIFKQHNHRLLILTGLLMISAGIVAPVSLLADLHQPARAWHFYMQSRTGSWMWFGAYILPIFNLLSILFGWLLLRDSLKEQGKNNDLLGRFCKLLALGKWQSSHLIKPVAIVTFLSATSVALYTGMEVMVVEARVLWHTPWLPVNLATTAVLAALGSLIVLNRFIKGYDQNTTKILIGWCSWALRIFILVAAVWVFFGGKSPDEASRLLTFSPTWQVSAIWIVITVLVLIALLIKKNRVNKIPALMIGIISIHLAWGLRWIILIQSQVVPKYGAGTYFYNIPWGPEGVLGIVGTFGLWIAIILFFSEIVRENQSPINKGA